MTAVGDLGADALVAGRRGVSLEDLNARAALQTRVDRKYVLAWEDLLDAAGRLPGGYEVLEIDTRRAFRYDTIYYDTSTLSAFRAHMQQRRRRYKVRSRHYVDSGIRVFEVKLKGPRGETIKHQLPYAADDHGRVTPQARAFLAERIGEAYPDLPIPVLDASVRTSYRRITLARGEERITCDFDLSFSDGDREISALEPGHVIVESKTGRGLGALDRELRRRALHPVTCSKYCVGVGLLRDDVKVNDLRWLLQRHFRRPLGVASA